MTDLSIPCAPSWISPPGDTIADAIEELGWSQRELADRLDSSPKHISQLINGKASLSEEMALKLETVLGSSAHFWLERESRYREALQREKQIKELECHKDWLSLLPIADMVRYGWICKHTRKAYQVAECLKFFGVASVDAWKRRQESTVAAFRSSDAFSKNQIAVDAWIRQGEIDARALHAAPYDEKVFRESLSDIRDLTLESDPSVFVPKLRDICRKAGVAVSFQPCPKQCPVSGAARWISDEKAVIQLSLRHKSNDHLWFTFFHEAGHILLHGRREEFVDLASPDGLSSVQEQEADQFARDTLIPPDEADHLEALGWQEAAVRSFAERIGIAPGIVVGRLQKEGLIPWSHLNGLKIRYQWNL